MRESRRGGHITASLMLVTLVLLWALSAPAAKAQEATVTFYITGYTLPNTIPGVRQGLFVGSIFDADTFLFRFHGNKPDRFEHRFITVSLPPGVHKFTATYARNPAKDPQVPLTLVSGEHYFLRVHAEAKGFFSAKGTGVIEQVNCKVAHNEIGNRKALVPSDVGPSVKATMSRDEALPSCP